MTESVSFKFTKKIEAKAIGRSVAASGEDVEIIEDRDIIHTVDNREIISQKPKETKREYVIPLIVKNDWRLATKPSESPAASTTKSTAVVTKDVEYVNVTNVVPSSPSDADLAKLAREALIREANEANDVWETRKDEPDSDRSIPLIMENKVPEGYESEEKFDVSLRPDGSDMTDYDAIPIEEFGKAMLRGMGWTEGGVIGSKNAKFVEMPEPKLRPKGLGLGADPKIAKGIGIASSSKDLKEGSANEDLKMKKGASVLILKGGPEVKGRYGRIESFDEDNCRVMVKLALGGNIISCSMYAVKLVSSKEYDKNSKVINRDLYEQHKIADDSDRKIADDPFAIVDGTNAATSSPKNKMKVSKSSASISDRERSRSRSPRHRKSLWVMPEIRVRIIDKKFAKGRYYKEKAIVVDVANFDHCTVRTDDRKLVDGLSQSMLETVIPKSDNSVVAIVKGRHRGELGRILSRNRDKSVAAVQLIRSSDEIVNVDFDDICEYCGNIQDDE